MRVVVVVLFALLAMLSCEAALAANLNLNGDPKVIVTNAALEIGKSITDGGRPLASIKMWDQDGEAVTIWTQDNTTSWDFKLPPTAGADGEVLTWQADGSTDWETAPGGGGGAPTNAQYVTLATDATLSDERVLTAGDGITITDGGAGSTVTVSAAMKRFGAKYVTTTDADDGLAISSDVGGAAVDVQQTLSGPGVKGATASGSGVWGISQDGYGLESQSDTKEGVYVDGVAGFDEMTAGEITTLGNPPTGKGYVYFKENGKPYSKDDAGTEYDLTDTGAADLWTTHGTTGGITQDTANQPVHIVGNAGNPEASAVLYVENEKDDSFGWAIIAGPDTFDSNDDANGIQASSGTSSGTAVMGQRGNSNNNYYGGDFSHTRVGAYSDMDELAAPANPPSSRVRSYALTDGLVYGKDDAGTVTKLSNEWEDVGGSGILRPITADDAIRVTTSTQSFAARLENLGASGNATDILATAGYGVSSHGTGAANVGGNQMSNMDGDYSLELVEGLEIGNKSGSNTTHAAISAPLSGSVGVYTIGGELYYKDEYDKLWGPLGTHDPSRKRLMQYLSNVGANTWTNVGFAAAPTTAGTLTSADDTDGQLIQFATTTTVNTDASIWSSFTSTSRDWEPEATLRFKTGTNGTNVRWAAGMFSASPLTSADPAISGAYFLYDSAAHGDNVWRAYSNDGVSTGTTTNTGVGIANNRTYDFRIKADASRVRFYINNELVATHTSNLPAASSTANMGVGAGVRVITTGGSAKNFRLGKIVLSHE